MPYFLLLQSGGLRYAAQHPPSVAACQTQAQGSTLRDSTGLNPDLSLHRRSVCSYKVHVWVDAAHEAVRIDFRGGIDKTYFIGVGDTPAAAPTAGVLAGYDWQPCLCAAVHSPAACSMRSTL